MSAEEPHIHYVVDLKYSGKTDSLDGVCIYGHSERMAIWGEKSLPGWSDCQWPILRRAIEALLHSITLHKITEAERADRIQ